MNFNRPPQGAGPPSISPRTTEFGPFAFQSTGPSQGATPLPNTSSPPLGTVLPPFFSKAQPQAHQKYVQGRFQNAPTSSTSTMPTFDKFKHEYVPAQNYKTRVWTAINDTSGATTGTTSGVVQGKVDNQGPFGANMRPHGVAQAQQGKINNQGPPFTGMFPPPQPMPNANQMTTRSGVQLMNFPPPPVDGPDVPQFQRPGYLIHFPDAPLPTKDLWVDYMTRHETYDPILVRLREAMSDVMAYCHTSYAPFATPEQYVQLKVPLVQRGPAPMFVATAVLKDTQAKGGIRPSDDDVKKKRRRMMVRIDENLTRLLEMKKKGISPMERMDALEDMANKELRRSGLFRTMITKLG
ncbi:hypothetical protein CPB97_012157 [Podila verticillata]|nr:hypothetical protein CPB97_012157 [Podila verticillata]